MKEIDDKIKRETKKYTGNRVGIRIVKKVEGYPAMYILDENGECWQVYESKFNQFSPEIVQGIVEKVVGKYTYYFRLDNGLIGEVTNPVNPRSGNRTAYANSKQV